MRNIAYIILGICAITFIFLIILLIKNEVTKHHQLLILDAIESYNKDKILALKFSETIDFNCMEYYDDTLFRLWDWGYKHIVPPETFEVIKPYIKKK